jgi:hypothetical protein
MKTRTITRKGESYDKGNKIRGRQRGTIHVMKEMFG